MKPDFRQAAEIWFAQNMAHCAQQTQSDLWRLLCTYVFPVFGDKRPKKIKSKHIVAAAENYRRSAPRSTRKFIQALVRIFDYCQAQGWCAHNPARCVHAVVKQSKSRGFAWVHPDAMPEFCDAIATHTDVAAVAEDVRLAFWLIAYTGARRSMVLKGLWAEINWQKRQ